MVTQTTRLKAHQILATNGVYFWQCDQMLELKMAKFFQKFPKK